MGGRIELIAKKGYTLTQVADVKIETRTYASRVYTSSPDEWKEVPISEFEEWKKEKEKLNPKKQLDYGKD